MLSIEREIPWPELEDSIRRVRMKKSGILPYEYSNIQLHRFFYDQMKTTSTYVARPLLRKQADIRLTLGLSGLHPLTLEGGVKLLSTEPDGDRLTGFVPPIVEETDEDGVYLLDGSHRANMGRWEGRESFIGIRIRGIRPDCAAYAFPNTWDEVKIYHQVPDARLRKNYRFKHPDGSIDEAASYELYRDFGPVNGSEERTTNNSPEA